MKASPRVVVVTGSSSGLGQAIAGRFLESGDQVMVHGFRNLAGITQTVGGCQTERERLRAVVADVAEADSRRRLVQAAFAWRGRVDVWVNAAGADVLTGPDQKLAFDAKLDKLWRVDVLGTIALSREVAVRMAGQPASDALPTILNISWDQAEHGMEGDSGQYFSATKAAIAAFSKSLAKTWGPQLRVNCLAPGWIQTAWGRNAPPAWVQRAHGESMLQRWGEAQDIAEVAWMLAHPRCEFINGQTLAVNGGWQPAYRRES
jgi:3-oxoacyl-[acyl-carrier protein] reductase